MGEVSDAAAVAEATPGETVTPVSSMTATEAKFVVIPKTALKAIHERRIC